MDTITAPAQVLDLAGRLALAAVLGAAIGFDRELLQKPAGTRTHALVALGAALLAVVGTLLAVPGVGQDLAAASRVIQGIVAGVGFIGGGVILRVESEQRVEGLTTAASVWVVSAVGIAAGLGLWRSAVITVVIAGVVLLLGRAAARRNE